MKFGIAARLSLAFACIAIVSGGVTGYFAYRDGRDRLIQEAQQRLVATSTVAANRLATTLAEASKDVLLLSQGPDAHHAFDGLKSSEAHSGQQSIDILAAHVIQLMTLKPLYKEVSLVSKDNFGLERLQILRGDDLTVQRSDEEDLREISHLSYVSQGMSQSPGELRIWPITLRRSGGVQEDLGEPTLIMTSVVPDVSGKPLGLVILKLRLTTLFQEILQNLPANFSLYLTNSSGDYLLHPDPSKAFAFERGQIARVQDEFPLTAKLLEVGNKFEPVLVQPGDIENGSLTVFIHPNFNNQHSNLTFVFGLSQPMKDLLAASTELKQRVLNLIALFSMIALVVAALLATAMTRQLRSMAQAMKVFAETGKSLPLPVARKDEIGQLAKSVAEAHLRITRTVSALEGKNLEMELLARHDPLTGIPNRLLFNERVSGAISRAKRTGSEVTLMLIDLDQFKPVNDKYGHAAGDVVLKAIAQRMQTSVREIDTVARLGGDEFVVLLEGVSQREQIEPIAHKLLAVINLPIEWGDIELHVGASIGINTYPIGGENLDALFSGADQAMYVAKQGKLGFVFNEPNK